MTKHSYTLFFTAPVAADEAWDCDPFLLPEQFNEYEDSINEEDDTGEWQTVCLDRWGDVRHTPLRQFKKGE